MSTKRSEAILAQLRAHRERAHAFYKRAVQQRNEMDEQFFLGAKCALGDLEDYIEGTEGNADIDAACEYELGAGWHCVRGCEKHR